VIAENDRESAEADYGAPLKGLECFHEFMRPDRAFQYDPVTTVDDVHHTHIDEKLMIARNMKAEGYLSLYDWAEEQSLASQVYFANGGVTRAFSDIATHIVQTFEDRNAMAQRLGRYQSGAIIVPVPTYGLFLHKLEEIVKGTNVEIVKVRRRDNGSIDRQSLRVKLDECFEENKRVIGFYDCNPNNPTGYIRDQEETEKLATILEDFTHRQMGQDEVFLDGYKQTDGALDENLKKAVSLLSFYYRDYTLGRPIIMDDMAYEGLELDDCKKPYSFAQSSDFIAEQTVVMKSISKIGMPGMRIGLAVADPEIIEHCLEKQLMDEFSANSLGVDILSARYGDHPKKYLFEEHQRDLRHAHQERFLFTQAFFRGIDNVPEMTEEQSAKLVREYARNSDLSMEEAKKRLQKGLPNFSVPNRLESGFFCSISFEALDGRQIAVKYDNKRWPELYNIKSSSVLYWTLRAFKVKCVAAVQQGMTDQSLSARMTLSMNEQDFYRFYDRMSAMHTFFFGDRPEVQMDLFRTNVPYPRR
jgi:aspartate/methionine/tyrosine aminotransferase